MCSDESVLTARTVSSLLNEQVEADPTCCSVYGPLCAEESKPTLLTVRLRDSLGQPLLRRDAKVVVKARLPSAKEDYADCTVSAGNDGEALIVSFTASARGIYDVRVDVDGRRLGGNPFQLPRQSLSVQGALAVASGSIFNALRLQVWGGFGFPADFCAGRSGDWFVCDEAGDRVLVLNSHGVLLHEWTVRKPRLVVRCERSRTLFVKESQRDRVHSFAEDGKALHSWDCACSGLAVDSEGLVYASMEDGTIHVFTAERKLVRKWGSKGKGDGQFDFVGGIAIGGDCVFACDNNNNRVQVFTLEGKFVGKFATAPCPWYIAVSVDGKDVFVASHEYDEPGWLRRWRAERDAACGKLSWKEVDLGL